MVSLVALHKGEWRGKRVLDGREVPVISAYFEDSLDAGEPRPIAENADHVFQGSIFLGDGFLLSHEEADHMKQRNLRLEKVIFPVMNGQEVNNRPDQAPGRQIINFFDWSLEKAETFGETFDHVRQLVKPERAKDNRALYRDRWWQYAEPRRKLTAKAGLIAHCFVATATTGNISAFSAASTNYVFLQTCSTSLPPTNGTTTPSSKVPPSRGLGAQIQRCIETGYSLLSLHSVSTPFRSPMDWCQTVNPALAAIGEHYHEYSCAFMRRLWLGLTDIYNLFHTRDLTPAQVAKVSKKSPEEAEAGYQGILELRRLHRVLDEAVRDAYGWHDLDLGHDFHEVETLPENDRVRYTISPTARKEVLRRLLALNYQRAAAQANMLHQCKRSAAKRVRQKLRTPPLTFSHRRPTHG